MSRDWRRPALALLFGLGLAALYAGILRTGFLNDDYLFLEEARRPLWQSLFSLGPLGNFYRPLSRQLFFAAFTPLAGAEALPFHLACFAVFLLALVLLADLLRVLAPPAGVAAGVLFFALLPMQRVNLIWISCIQDLLALTFCLGSVALYRRGRLGLSALVYLLAVLSKESALPLPLALLAWDRWVEGRGAVEGRRVRAHAALALAWGAGTVAFRAFHPGAAFPLRFDPGAFLAAYAHGVQSLLGLEQPNGLFRSLGRHLPPVLPLVSLGAVALLLPRGNGQPYPAPRDGIRFGLAWVLAFAFVVGPVAAIWSGYYYTLAAVGGAAIVAIAARRIGAPGWVLLAAGLLWWNVGAGAVRAFAVAESPWTWTSHLTPYYFQRASALGETLGHDLVRLEPRPERNTRFFFTNLPPWAGFQMGNGAAIRTLYRDPSLESYFYSQFSESTAADFPCRFLSWNGVALEPLYDPRSDVFFQVGSDLLVLDRPRGALHAFRRGLMRHETREDLYYWIGWTEFWLGRRNRAELAWSEAGAKDDSLQWYTAMRVARQYLVERRDTLNARRALAIAIQSRIGHPDAHAMLGSLLLPSRPKYGMLELKVAIGLRPTDWMARRDLVVGLISQRLDEQADRELARLVAIHPDFHDDREFGAAVRLLERRNPKSDVIEF